MVSKAREDLPEPESPVMQISLFRGRRTVTSLRLCSRAPWTTSSSEAISDPVYPGKSDRTNVRFEQRKGALRAVSAVREARPGGVPRPVRGAVAHARAHGVEQDVFARLREVVLRLDDPRAEAGAEEVSTAVVASVEGLRVDAVEPF